MFDTGSFTLSATTFVLSNCPELNVDMPIVPSNFSELLKEGVDDVLSDLSKM